MKKLSYLLSTLLVLLLFTNCGGTKVATGDVKVNVPCSGPEFRTDKGYFRAHAMGLSTDMSIAKKKAMSNARTELAGAINAKVKSVTDHYASSYQQGEQEEAKSRYQQLTRTVVEQELTGLRVICEETMRSSDGNYKVYVAVELSGEDIASKLANRIKNDEKLRIDFEYEKFKKVFNEEMSKSAQQ